MTVVVSAGATHPRRVRRTYAGSRVWSADAGRGARDDAFPPSMTTPHPPDSQAALGIALARAHVRDSSPRSGPIRSVLLACAIVISVSVLAFVALKGRRARAALPHRGAIPAFVATNQQGRTVDAQALHGQVLVVDFFFTACPVACPRLAQRMQEVQRALADRPATRRPIRLVSMSVDPDNDTPERLAHYADRYQADPARWWFLTGRTQDLERVVVDGFAVQYAPAQPSVGIDQIMHGNWFVLVDAGGDIRGYYLTDDAQRTAALIEDARRLADEG
jgi:protein SCO1/2